MPTCLSFLYLAPCGVLQLSACECRAEFSDQACFNKFRIAPLFYSILFWPGSLRCGADWWCECWWLCYSNSSVIDEGPSFLLWEVSLSPQPPWISFSFLPLPPILTPHPAFSSHPFLSSVSCYRLVVLVDLCLALPVHGCVCVWWK